MAVQLWPPHTLVRRGNVRRGRMQVPAQVEYEKAASVEHALALLARYGPEARVLAGGHSLIPMMKLRLAQPETLVDINGLSELSYLLLSTANCGSARSPGTPSCSARHRPGSTSRSCTTR